MAAPLIVRLVMDAAGYLKTVDTAVASNTKLEQSSLGVGEAMQVSATKSVQASLRATEALQAQVAGYRELAASATQSAAVRERADLLANRAQGRLNSSLGLQAATTRGVSKETQTAERDLGKFTRGALAGSGAASSLGRSLAFASTGFIAVAGTATIIASSIKAALSLAKTQSQTDAQLKTSGKSWAQYGQAIDAADLKLSHISGFTNQELLQGFGYLVRENGNVSESLKLTAEAADVARGRNISLASAAIALAKAQGGSVTALRRLGIIVPKGVTGLAALAFVQQKFAGQAEAGATVTDRFHASLVNAEEIIGGALLPTFTRLTTELGNWLSRMNETGRLQRDVNEAVSIAGTVFHTLGDVIHYVDKVTGSFKTTLELVLGLRVAFLISGWVTSLSALAAEWGIVGAAAAGAGAAQTAALTEGAGARIAGAGAGAAAAEGAGAGAFAISVPEVAAILGVAIGVNKIRQGGLNNINPLADPLKNAVQNVTLKAFQAGAITAQQAIAAGLTSIPGQPVVTSALRRGGNLAPSFFPSNLRFQTGTGGNIQGPPSGPFGTATPIAVYTKYTQTITEQLAVAQAALTKTTKDDVAAAKSIIARIKRLIDQGHLSGASLVQALQDEATQQGVLTSARQAAAQQAAKIAAAKKAAASSYTTPIDLQLAEARAQLTATSADDISAEKGILAAAKAAVASGKKNKQGQLAALQVEIQAQQALDSLRSQSSTTFTQSLKLQLALAKAQALGTSQTAILEKMKAALEKALKASKGNIQKQIDIYNQISQINSQLGSSAASALGSFKQLNIDKVAKSLHLTASQAKALKAQLSQVGPGGTVPGSGTGAYGYQIGRGGRPRQVHHHHHHHHVHVDIDGKQVDASVRKHAHRRHARNSSQRRGPNAGDDD